MAFIARFQPLIASSVLRVVRGYGVSDPSLVDDLIQETYLRLCKDNCRSLREFESRHDEAIFGFLKVTATNIARDYFRARATEKRRAEVEAKVDDPEPWISSRDVEQSVLMSELNSHLAASESERDRTIFWLYYRQGFTAKDIAQMIGGELSESGVESCIYRITRTLRDTVARFGEGAGSRKSFGGVR